ncbi:Alpha/Beta hydrolase protein [Scenedesmus sp. NREL 46B-D3]|nr:Alpha/Beta hydrolase protein [Scenedesmus sp. NREL 46B-D3]
MMQADSAQQQQQQQVTAMGGLLSSTADPEALNAQYEATLPQYKSRIYDQVAARGYPLERHAVITPDGYELIVHRIPYGKLRNNQPGVKKPVVFLQHGITLASDCFTVFGANESMAYILSDAGYDVWLGNTRGNTYSRRNINGLHPYQAEFWYFSMDEMALVDVPAMIDHVLAQTGASKLAFVGHSQGGTLGSMLCAARPEYNQKISVLALLGPVVFVDFMQSAFLKVFTNELDQPWQVSGEFLLNRLVAPVYKTLCSHWPMDEVCVAAISFVSFGPSVHVTAADYLTLSASWPSSAGSRNLVHWGQTYKSRELELRMFDHGIACNLTTWHPLHGFKPKPFKETCNAAKYGSTVPPAYDLTKVTAPVVIFAAGDRPYGKLTAKKANQLLDVRRLGAAHKRTIMYPDYTHMDFSWDRNARVPADLLGVLQQYSPGTY